MKAEYTMENKTEAAVENTGENTEKGIKENGIRLPAVALRGMTILPQTVIHFDLSREKSILSVERAMVGDQRLFLVTQKNLEENDPTYEQLYEVGTIALIKQVIKLPNGIVRVLVEGTERGRLLSLVEEGPLAGSEELIAGRTEKEVPGETGADKAPGAVALVAEVEALQETDLLTGTPEGEAMVREIRELFAGYAAFYPKIGSSLGKHVEYLTGLGLLIDQITINIRLDYEKKQEILSAVDWEERFERFSAILSNEIEIARVKTELAEQIRGRVDKNQKEYLLREQLQFIREELGEDHTFSDVAQFEAELQKLKAPKEVKEKIKKEISRFKAIGSNSSESAVERGYIETLLELPWERRSRDNTDIVRAEQILDRDHYGLAKVKERVVEALAVRCLTGQGQTPILCLVGPPGTGKTSIARSVAEAMNKKYVRICLGGVRDEAEIRGHRRTYVGAMPGRIVAGLKQAGVKNPLMLLDEIDKVSSDYKGDTSSALLEVLDSEQNVHFRDHYVEIPVDLSEVLFIATANSVSTIPRPLLDRMEVIEVTSYTANEKFHIAREHLTAKQMQKNGLSAGQLSISDSAIKKIIEAYTREAGVRELERKLAGICRKAAREILRNHKNGIRVTAAGLEKYLGKEKYSTNPVNDRDEVGIARGLAWTSVGGETLQIEVNRMPGKGEVELTGQMGDVMKESARTGISYVRSIAGAYKIPQDTFKKHDFHIHIPEGAVPKDGPSAGITMATALLSAITGIPVRADVAMTGEITLRGRVLPIGGLKEKILAARTAGITTVLVPKKNEKDVEEISAEIKSGLKICFAENMEEVLTLSLVHPQASEATESTGTDQKSMAAGKKHRNR